MPETLADPSDDSQALRTLPPETPLADYLAWTNAVHASPPIYHVACALTFCAYTLCRRGFGIETLFERTHPTLQFVMLGASGCGKSTAIKLGRDFADDVWREASITLANPRVQPAGSIPGILGALQPLYDRRHNITPAWLIHDEVAQLFNSREPIAELLCQLTDGRTIEHRTKTAQRQRNSDELEKLINPRVAALFASTEAQLAPHFKESHRSGGVFARMLWIRPPLLSHHNYQEPATVEFLEHVRTLRQRAVGSFAQWEGLLSLVDAEDGTTFSFEPEAEAALHAFREELKRKSDTHDGLQGQRNRASDRARVIAAIFAAQRGRLTIPLEHVERAIALLQLLLRYAGDTLESEELAGDSLERLCTRVEGVVRKAGERGLRRGKIYTKVRLSKDSLDRVLETLKDRERVFADTRNPNEPGVLVHSATEAGKRLLQHRQERDARAAAFKALGEPDVN